MKDFNRNLEKSTYSLNKFIEYPASPTLPNAERYNFKGNLEESNLFAIKR